MPNNKDPRALDESVTTKRSNIEEKPKKHRFKKADPLEFVIEERSHRDLRSDYVKELIAELDRKSESHDYKKSETCDWEFLSKMKKPKQSVADVKQVAPERKPSDDLYKSLPQASAIKRPRLMEHLPFMPYGPFNGVSLGNFMKSVNKSISSLKRKKVGHDQRKWTDLLKQVGTKFQHPKLVKFFDAGMGRILFKIFRK